MAYTQKKRVIFRFPKIDSSTWANFLNEVGRQGVRTTRDAVSKFNWSTKDAQKHIKASIQYSISQNRVIISSNHPASPYLNRGVKPHVMWYLVQGKDRSKPIPMSVGGQTFFRYATPWALSHGRWKHPGISPRSYLKEGRKKIVSTVIPRVTKQMFGI